MSWSQRCRAEFDHLSVYCFGDGWKATSGAVHDSERDRALLASIRACPTVELACRDLLARERVITSGEVLEDIWRERQERV